MTSFDIDQFLAPISDDEPCGPDLEYDPELAELEQACKGKPEQQYGDTLIEAEEPDWKNARKLALKLLERTKDFRVAVPLTNACLSLNDLEGFKNSIVLINHFLNEYWDDVYPQLDVDDDNDPTERVNALSGLLSPSGTLHMLRSLPLVSLQGVGSFSYAEIEHVKANPGSEEPPTLAAIEGAFQDCNLDDLNCVADILTAAKECVSALESRLTMNVGSSSAIDMSPLSHLIGEIVTTLGDYIQKRDHESSPNQPTGNESEEVSENAGSAPKGSLDGEIRGREDVIRAIDRICEYYEKYEPSSPLPLLLNRAKRLATKSFMEIIKDLTPDALGQASSIGGIELPEGQGEEEY